MFALILWLETKEISVLNFKDIKITKKRGVQAKWGNAWYSAQILKKSEQREWLESLEVSAEGNILTPDKKFTTPPHLKMKKREDKLRGKEVEALRKATTAEENEYILNATPIFQASGESENGSSDESTEKEGVSEKSEDESPRDDQFNKSDIDGSDTENSINDLTSVERNTNVSSVQRTQSTSSVLQEADKKKKLKSCLCSKLPSISEADLTNLNYILELAKSIHVLQNKGGEIFVPTNESLKIPQAGNKVQLVKNPGVEVDEWKLNGIVKTCHKNPREMVRKLMKLILGEPLLRKMSPTGKVHWNPIPENIYEAVYEFVNAQAKKQKYKISPQNYRQILTAMCATLRNPRDKRTSNNTGRQLSKITGDAVAQNTERRKEDEREKDGERKKDENTKETEKKNEEESRKETSKKKDEERKQIEQRQKEEECNWEKEKKKEKERKKNEQRQKEEERRTEAEKKKEEERKKGEPRQIEKENKNKAEKKKKEGSESENSNNINEELIEKENQKTKILKRKIEIKKDNKSRDKKDFKKKPKIV